MRDKIINLLRQNIGKPVSGEEISKIISISRTAVWKHIQQLKNSGYDIESVYKKGYILHATPDKLLPNEVLASLKTKWLGHNVIYHTSVNSTNDIAKKAALDNCPNGTIIIAEEQVSGKGRISRGWFSPLSAGVWFSIVLRPPFLPHDAPKFTLLMAVALAKAFDAYPGIKVGIKWPNDILVQGKKIVGILTEMNAEMEAINYIVIGTGINVNVSKEIMPDDIKDKAASLSDFTDKTVDRIKVITAVLKSLEDIYEKTVAEGFAYMFEEWKKYTITLGKTVSVVAPDETFLGVAENIDEMGALLVKRENGVIERVLAGDVSIRASNKENYI